MNKTLKYRVWISHWGNAEPKSEMVYIPDLHLHVYLGNWERGGYKDAIFQQFTGLLDKGRKEIFNGDIVRILSCEDPEDLQWDIGQIVYNIGAYYIVYDSGAMELLQEYYMNEGYAQVEVIGNIFENPELLKK